VNSGPALGRPNSSSGVKPGGKQPDYKSGDVRKQGLPEHRQGSGKPTMFDDFDDDPDGEFVTHNPKGNKHLFGGIIAAAGGAPTQPAKAKVSAASSQRPLSYSMNIMVPTDAMFEKIKNDVALIPNSELIKSTIALTNEEASLLDVLNDNNQLLPAALFKRPVSDLQEVSQYYQGLSVKVSVAEFYSQIICDGLERNGKRSDDVNPDSVGVYLEWAQKKYPNFYLVLKALKKIRDFMAEVDRLRHTDPDTLRRRRAIANYQRVLNDFDAQFAKERKRIIKHLDELQSSAAPPEPTTTDLATFVASSFRSPAPPTPARSFTFGGGKPVVERSDVGSGEGDDGSAPGDEEDAFAEEIGN